MTPKAGVFLKLFHGRDSDEQDMNDDWGFDGPTLECGNVLEYPRRVGLREGLALVVVAKGFQFVQGVHVGRSTPGRRLPSTPAFRPRPPAARS